MRKEGSTNIYLIYAGYTDTYSEFRSWKQVTEKTMQALLRGCALKNGDLGIHVCEPEDEERQCWLLSAGRKEVPPLKPTPHFTAQDAGARGLPPCSPVSTVLRPVLTGCGPGCAQCGPLAFRAGVGGSEAGSRLTRCSAQ